PSFAKTFDIGSNAAIGSEYEKFVTFAGVTGAKFRLRLSAAEQDVHIKLIAVTFKRRLETRQT
ncbi:MAG TPA: hypothetical protein VM537_29210, partial [Anaerolineae bacterium]|nr:hypothetical protein [Anaerolineae bacterium]